MAPQENLTCDSIQAYLYGDRARLSEATFPSHPASTNFRLLPPSGNKPRKPLDHTTGSVGTSVQGQCRYSSATTRVVVECFAEQAADARAWLERAMIEGVDTVMNSASKVRVPVEVEARMVRRWGEGG